jgi:CBS domain-containing protein
MTRELITVSPQTEITAAAKIILEKRINGLPVTVGPETDIEDIARLMVDKKYHTLPVMEGDKIVGVVGKEDVLKTLLP